MGEGGGGGNVRSTKRPGPDMVHRTNNASCKLSLNCFHKMAVLVNS